MQRNALQLFAIVALVVLAGCSGGLSGGDATATDDGPTLDDVSYPPGVSENGTNVSALAEAHAGVLENESFALTADSVMNSSMTNQSVRLEAAVNEDRDSVLVDGSMRGQQVSMYLTAEKRYTRIGTGNGSTYRTTDRTSDAVKLVPSSFTGTNYLGQFAGVGDFTPTDAREANGTTVVALEADGSNATEAATANLTDYEATMLVDERGVVRSMTVDATSTTRGRQYSTSFSMKIESVGATTVSEPAWLDEARNSTSS